MIKLSTVVLALVMLVTAAPITTFAATANAKPSCTLSVSTALKKIGRATDREMTVLGGTLIKFEWTSSRAKTATDSDGFTIPLDGTATNTIDSTTKFTYHFQNGSNQVTCSVLVNVVSATINPSSLRTSVSKPTLTGTASSTKSVKVVVRDGKKTVFSKNSVSAPKGKWTVKLNKALKNGDYDVFIYGGKDLKYPLLATSTLIIGPKSEASVSISPILLLFGGTAKVNTSVPVAYIKVQNTSDEIAHIRGFTLVQKGSAPTVAVNGFTTSDDKGGSRSTLLGGPTSMPFNKDKTVFVPLVADVAGKQFRIFTIKAMLGPSAILSIGKQLSIDVVSIDADAKVSGKFPIRGTSWTISY